MKETAYLLQACLISLWWLCLATMNSVFQAFQFNGISSIAFWSFFAPDILLIAFLSLIRSYKKVAILEYVILGAFAYATLYCCNASILTKSGFLASIFMLIGLSYNIFLCFHENLFRASSSRNFFYNFCKTIIQVVCIWFLTLVIIPYVLLDNFGSLESLETDGVFCVGILFFVFFSSLGLTSSYFMVRDGEGTPLPLDQTNKLVISGPYRYVRNPMAIAGIGQGLAIAIIFLSLPIAVYSLLGSLIWHYAIRPYEERDMEERFGDLYSCYRGRVSCWLPNKFVKRILMSQSEKD